MVDGVSFPVGGGYAPIGIQPVESAPATVPAPAPAPVPAPVASSSSPSLVLDFSQGLSTGYVLDWRDPTTDQVLVQIPMRTAFRQFTPASSGQVGKHIDTEA